MSLFGEYLRSVVETNKVNIYGLAKQAGLERTAIYKIMSGGRIPAEEYVQKLSEALPLSPEERRRFLESYRISSIGEHKYKQRMQVKALIESIVQMEKVFKIEQSHYGASPMHENNQNTVVVGNFAVNNLVKSLIMESLTHDNNPAIDFVVPDSYQYFYNELLACYANHPQAQIRHIIAFSKKIDFIDNTNTNIRLLTHILPFAFMSGLGYRPYYFYKSTLDIEITHAMPYFILTASNKLVLINRHFNKAALICDRDIVAIYQDSFQTMLEQSNALLENFKSIFETLEHYIDVGDQSKGEPFHWIEPEPCIGSLFTPELIDMMVKADMPNREALKELVHRNYSSLRENQLRNINVCTTDGALRLIDAGMMYYAPSELVDPMPRPAMKAVMTQLRKRAADNKVKLLFSNPSQITLPSKTLLTISRKSGINFIMKKDDENHQSKFMCICLSEESINEAFVDFVESIEDSGLVYSEQDSVKTLDSIIEKI